VWRLVWSDAVSLECDAGTSADALAERISALAGGDVFWQAGRIAGGSGHIRIYVGAEVGAFEFSVLDGRPGAGGASEALMWISAGRVHESWWISIHAPK